MTEYELFKFNCQYKAFKTKKQVKVIILAME